MNRRTPQFDRQFRARSSAWRIGCFVLGAVFSGWMATVALAAEPSAALTNMHDILGFTRSQAIESRAPIRLRAVVTYRDPGNGWFFLQEGTNAILVVPVDPTLVRRAGEWVEVDGVSSHGSYAPFVDRAVARPIGQLPLPEAQPISLGAAAANRHFPRRVSVSGVVRDVARTPGGLHVQLATNRESAVVLVPWAAGEPLPTNWLGASLRATGINWTSDGDVRVSSTNDQEMAIRPSAPLFELPISPAAASSIPGTEPANGLVRLRGVVQLVIQGGSVFLRDGDTAFRARPLARLHNRSIARDEFFQPLPRTLEPGDEVEVFAEASTNRAMRTLDAAQFRVVGRGRIEPARRVAAARVSAGDHDNELVIVRGELTERSVVGPSGGIRQDVLSLWGDAVRYQSSLNQPATNPAVRLPLGEEVEVTGFVVRPGRDGHEFWILPREAGDMRHVGPSATVRRRQLLLAVAGLAVVIVAGFAWVIYLRRQVTRQAGEARERETLHSALAESELKFRLLFERNSDAILILDSKLFKFTDCNEATVKMLRAKSKEEVCNTHPAALSPEIQPDGRNSYEKADEIIQRMYELGSQRFEWMHRRLDGEDFLVEVSLTAVQIADRPIIVTVWREIGDRKRAEAAIRELNATLEARVEQRTGELRQAQADLEKALVQEKELAALKTNFVSMVSHEFRTPLGVISVSSEVLSRYFDRLAPEQRAEHLAAIVENVRRMSRMMEDVLLLSRVDSGRMEFKPAPLDLAGFCRKLVDEVHSATNRACPIEVRCDLAPDAAAQADEALLRHILTNLLSNAVKYSPAGSPVLLRVVREDGVAVFEIADNGMGIPMEDQERLFSAFHRAKNAEHIHGTGLGLVIVKRCCDLHGGSIALRSTEGAGTTFSVRLPLFGG